MSKIKVYSSENCGYCTMAKQLLDEKGVTYEEIRVDIDPTALATMIELSGRRTVPQIFVDEKPIGGFDDLKSLETSGKLDELLRSK